VRNPLTDMTRAAASMADGELSRRIPEPRVAEFAALARALNHLAGSLEQTRDMQAELTAELVNLQRNERKSLARELHDDLGQRLAVIAAETHLLRVQLKSDGGAVRSIAAGIQSLQHSVRSMLERLRQGQPMVLPDPDAAAILEDWRRREPGVRWLVDNLSADALQALDDASRQALARVLQEALTNAFRHARPTYLSVRLLREAQAWQVGIVNDGVPVTRSGLPVPADQGMIQRVSEGHGILGMCERAQGAGGTLHSGRRAEPGTWEVLLRLPKAKADARPRLQAVGE